jgi:U6 snRNA-associated Sm-like protein LSm1
VRQPCLGLYFALTEAANLVLTECSERIAARNPEAATDAPVPKWLICDVKLPGLMTIRGENVTICATVDLDREDEPKGVKFAPEEQVRELANAQRNRKKASEARKAKAFKAAGIETGFGMAV